MLNGVSRYSYIIYHWPVVLDCGLFFVLYFCVAGAA